MEIENPPEGVSYFRAKDDFLGGAVTLSFGLLAPQ
jgi:hypothetical protein